MKQARKTFNRIIDTIRKNTTENWHSVSGYQLVVADIFLKEKTKRILYTNYFN